MLDAYTSVLDPMSSIFVLSSSLNLNSYILESIDSEILLFASSTQLHSIFITPSTTIFRRITYRLGDSTKMISVFRTGILYFHC